MHHETNSEGDVPTMAKNVSSAWILKIRKSYLFFTALQVNGRNLEKSMLSAARNI